MKTLFFVFVFFILSTFLSATIIDIPADQPTIQAGINVAVDGDTVLVQPGTYAENINYNGKNVTVASLFLTTQDTTYTSQTIIDGNQNGSVVTFENEEDSTAVLTGFKITNGNASSGGGIYYYDSSPSLINITISDNNAGSGGGVYNCYNSSPDLINVTISENNAVYGGGINICYNSSSSLINVTVSGNNAVYGGGIFCKASSPNLENVTITENSAGNLGGGIFCEYNSSPNLVNCILWCDSLNEIVFSPYVQANSITISYSDIQDGENGIVTNNNGTVYWLEGNIDADPLFADPLNGDFHLTWANFPIPDSTMSPCIDTGDPNSPLDPDGTIADMGAYYYDQGTGTDNYELQISNFKLNNYPNHFNPSTTISFNISSKDAEDAEIIIYNIKGQKVKTFLNLQINKSPNQQIIWDGTDENNHPVSSGIYFYQLKVDGKQIDTKKCLLLK
jgi:predicted outer membrane repeat protein